MNRLLIRENLVEGRPVLFAGGHLTVWVALRDIVHVGINTAFEDGREAVVGVGLLEIGRDMNIDEGWDMTQIE